MWAWTEQNEDEYEDDSDERLYDFSKCASQLSGVYDLGVLLLDEKSPANDRVTAMITASFVTEIGACPTRSIVRACIGGDDFLTRLVTDRSDKIDDAAQHSAKQEI